MKRFSQLYTSLDATTKTTGKTAVLVDYFSEADPADAAWAIYFLSGKKLQRLVSMKLLRTWSAEVAGIEDWMFDECYEVVGDLAEVMALILPAPESQSDVPLHEWVTQRLLPLKKLTEPEQRSAMVGYWQQLDQTERFVLHKLMTGAFRVGVSQKMVVKALAQRFGLPSEVLAHRLMGDWGPSAEFFNSLMNADTGDAHISQPYPFFLAHPLEADVETLGPVTDWQAEWKWDGIRAQMLKRDDQFFIWSRGEELMTDRFPELTAIADSVPNGSAVDGEIVAFKDGGILPFSQMQRRIGRKKPGKKILSDIPVSFIAFDLLEWQGRDVRQEPLTFRRQQLQGIVDAVATENPNTAIQLSKELPCQSWSDLAELRQQSRENQAEGLMLKRRDSPYRVGRHRGDWWKWKIEPYTVDAVLTYAQRGSGRRASLYSDYTFGIWNDGELVTFAKAYSGLTDEEIAEVDRFVRANTLERFGPVRSVTPKLVFELAFENIQVSKRHKSGIAVRFPRIIRWRHDLKIEAADSLEYVKAMIE